LILLIFLIEDHFLLLLSAFHVEFIAGLLTGQWFYRS